MPIFTERCGAARVSPPAGPAKGSSAIARTARALVQYLLFQERLDLGERALLGLPGDVVCAGQRNLRHRGRLRRQAGQEEHRTVAEECPPPAAEVGPMSQGAQHIKRIRRISEFVYLRP